MIEMIDIKKVFFLILVSSLLIGSAYASDLTSFNINNTYKVAYNDSYHVLYLNDNHNAGVTVYKNVDDDQYDTDDGDDDQYDNLIEDDGRSYLHPDDDYKLKKHNDKTASFKDYDNNEHGIVELIKNNDGQEYIVVFWAKNNNDIKNKDLKLQLKQFNKDNDVNIITF